MLSGTIIWLLRDNSVAVFALGMGRSIDLPAPLQNAENRDFADGSTPAFVFTPSAKIPFIDLDCSRQGTGFGQFFDNHPAQALVKQHSGMAGHTDQFGSSPRRGACDKMFNQPIPFSRTPPTCSLIQGATITQPLSLS